MPKQLVNPTTGGRFQASDRTVPYWLRHGWEIAPPPPAKHTAPVDAEPGVVEPTDAAPSDAAPGPTDPAPPVGEAATTQEED